jgi:FKBP-type peptidyl-prolyl cis-trans isomerase FkpA
MTSRFLFVCFIFIIHACGRPVQDPSQNEDAGQKKASESLVQINKYLLIRQQDQISSFVKRMGWEMTKTSTGLWYGIYENGQGNKAAKEKIISLHYTISLLDGTLCESSHESSPKSFRIGHGGVEAGLEEGVLLLREGDKARFIMPPHLAHGNFGDNNKIPPGAILLFDVEVIQIK